MPTEQELKRFKVFAEGVAEKLNSFIANPSTVTKTANDFRRWTGSLGFYDDSSEMSRLENQFADLQREKSGKMTFPAERERLERLIRKVMIKMVELAVKSARRVP